MAASNIARFYTSADQFMCELDCESFTRSAKVNVGSLRGGGRVRDLRMKAAADGKSGSSSHVSVERINGKKVNGVNGYDESIAAAAAPFVGSNWSGIEWVNHGGGGGGGDVPTQAFKLGRFVEHKFVYRQTFVIRSYEIGPDRTATMETLMNLLQETALNHVTCSGLAGDGFGATREMSLRKLIWVVTRINIQVDKYSHWGDVIEIDTWVAAAGKNGMRRDWLIRDYTTQKIITKATSTWVIMNRETRKLSKIPEQVREEVRPFYLDRMAMESEGDNKRIDKLNDGMAGSIRSGLAPRWSDMDVNQHVNNVKYIGWILESVPLKVLKDYNLTSMTLEYHRECRQSHLLESLTSMRGLEDADYLRSTHRCNGDLRSTHLLRLQEDKAEIVRARAEWQSKQPK